MDLCEAHPIFSRYEVTPQARFLFDSGACAVERVVSSDSWALVPDLVPDAFSDRIQVIEHPKDWDATYFIAVVVRDGRENHPIVQALRERLQEGLNRKKG